MTLVMNLAFAMATAEIRRTMAGSRCFQKSARD